MLAPTEAAVVLPKELQTKTIYKLGRKKMAMAGV
jgi:hypothetical protein